MKRIRYDILILSALFVLYCLSGCTRRDLLDYPEKVPFKIVLDWGYYVKPSATGYYLYDDRGSEPLYLEGTADGFEGYVPPGTYRIAVFNTDPVNASVRNTGNFDEDYFVATPLQQRSDPGMIASVRNVYGTGITGVVVPRYTDKPIVHRASPVQLVRRVSYTIDTQPILGIESLELFQGGAMVDKCIVSNKPLTGNTTSLYGKATFDEGKKLYLTELSAFGFVGPCLLTATATLDDGTTMTTIPVDLTEDLIDYSEEDITINIVLRFEDIGDIKVAVKVHGWKVGGSGGSIIQ